MWLCGSCILAEDNEAFIYFHSTGYLVVKTFRYTMGNPDRRTKLYTENSLLSHLKIQIYSGFRNMFDRKWPLIDGDAINEHGVPPNIDNFRIEHI